MPRPSRHTLALICAVGLAILAAACGTAAPPLVAGSPVVPVRVGVANAYLVLGQRPILVDPGGPGTRHAEAVERALAARGMAPTDLALIVLTHGHADHAGGAAHWAEVSGAPVLAGAGDCPMLAAGDHGRLAPQGAEARLILPFIERHFPPVVPDTLVRTTAVDLRPWGVAGEVRPAPGHTAGSLVVMLDGPAGREAIVGDLFRGGAMGGRLQPRRPHRHYFHEDADRAEAHVRTLLANGVTRFYLGHGGPIRAADAARRFGRAPQAR